VNRQRSNFAQSLQAMQQLAQLNPALGQVLGSPDVFPALVDGVLRLYDFPTRHEVMRGLREWQGQAKAQEAQAEQMQAMGMAPPGPPGAPPGGPPGPGQPPGPPGGPPPGPGGPPGGPPQGPPPPEMPASMRPGPGMSAGAGRGIAKGLAHLQQLPPGMVQ
jgi:hypothetical protein